MILDSRFPYESGGFLGLFHSIWAAKRAQRENLDWSKVPSFLRFSSRCKKPVDWIRLLGYSQAVNNLYINLNIGETLCPKIYAAAASSQ